MGVVARIIVMGYVTFVHLDTILTTITMWLSVL